MSETIDLQAKILNEIALIADLNHAQLSLDTPLIGEGSYLNSMKLVELCLRLEDIGNDLGFEFDWTSDAAMSRSRSMFRTAGSLIAEFKNQMEAK